MQLSLTIKNPQIIKKFKDAPIKLGNSINNVLYKTGAFTLGEVKNVITQGTGMWKPPIDTGQMRQGINLRKGNKVVKIMPSKRTDYAVFVHEGTRKMRARPFFDITISQKEKTISDFFNRELEKEINTLIK